MVHFKCIRDIKYDDYDEVWFCVRSLKAKPSNPKVYHVPLLSPSQELFNQFWRWKNAGVWNLDTFNNQYVPRFMQEMLKPEAKNKLAELATLSHTKEIAVACFCPTETLCHRKLLRSIVQVMGGDTD